MGCKIRSLRKEMEKMKSPQAMMKVRMLAVAMAGLARGMMILVKIRKSPALSIKAASISPVGMAWM